MSDVALRPDPSPRLEAAFRAVAARMAGLGFVNPALDVEAVGFAPWHGHWLGVLVTPWFMNLTLAPREPALWRSLAHGAKRTYVFPAGEYEFIGAGDDAAGEYQLCSLLSPVREFADHATARRVAQLARSALFDPALADAPATRAADFAPASRPSSGIEGRLAAPLTRRELLRGRRAGSDRDSRR
jgi:[NiFe] hydrogenase assembly HybE family chaperone